jgi:hypothetical protein
MKGGRTVAARAYASSVLPAVSIEGGCPEPLARDLRGAAGSLSFRRFELAHQGSYEVSEAAPPVEAAALAIETASACARAPVEIVAHRWVRLRRGDYVLVRDDAERFRRLAPAGIECFVDLSDRASGEAELVFTHRGQAFFTMPQRPRELAVVARGPTIRRYTRYLTHRLGELTVLRLEFALSPIRR